MHSSSNINLDNCSAEHLYPIQLDQSSNSDASGISMLLHEDITCKGIVPENTHHISNALGSCLRSCSQAELQNAPHGNTIGHLSARRHSSPTANAYGPHEWTLSRGHQAKRARVENIIKEITGFPNSMHFTDVITRKSQHEESDNRQENTKTRELLPYQHSPAGGTGCIHHWNQQNATVSTLLQSRHKPLGNLRTRLTQEDAGLVSEEVQDEEGNGNSSTWNASPKTFEKDTSYQYNECVGHSSEKDHGGKKLKLLNYVQSRPDKVNTLMADILKCELSRAVSMSVDSIFKKTQPERSPCMNSKETNNFNQSSLTQQFISENNNSRRSCYNTQGVKIPETQTEALSLVLHKPVQAKPCTANLLTVRAHQHPTHSFPNQHIALQEDQGSKRVPNAPQHINALRSLQDGYTGEGQPKLLDVFWNSVKVRSKVNSKSVRSSQMAIPVDPMFLEILCPHIKIESDDLQSIINNPLTLNDGLTTNHLKKAKLMFFYTRYPSSLVLKTIFHDVQFTRCITSQLIKWFSNFREFYYIQMEKYARHAITEGAANMRSLTVGRESELFRALNMHYNKANDFQVPDRFLEVSEITLREFYIAISMGKDSDPSWKKAIYKVICKLDSEVPDEFKSPL